MKIEWKIIQEEPFRATQAEHGHFVLGVQEANVYENGEIVLVWWWSVNHYELKPGWGTYVPDRSIWYQMTEREAQLAAEKHMFDNWAEYERRMREPRPPVTCIDDGVN